MLILSKALCCILLGFLNVLVGSTSI